MSIHWLTPLVLAFVPGPRADSLPRPPMEEGPAVLESAWCARCHSNAAGATAMRDAKGREIGPYDLWRTSMMANSARDPFWRAAVSVEVAATPSQAEAIERKCLRCHAPMADAVGLADHGTGALSHVLECEGRVGDLARDGVSCTICHGMSAEGFGSDQGFTGLFRLDPALRLFGPHEGPFAMPMRRQTGFTPTHGPHVLEAAACGTCHTLETDALDAEGNALGVRHPEQTPYLEWRNSSFQDEADPGPKAASCAACHLPATDADGAPIQTRIARSPMGRDWAPIGPRAPFGEHRLVGGNAQILQVVRTQQADAAGAPDAAAFDATLAATRAQLAGRTSRLEWGESARDPDRLRFAVRVRNLTGHKLPTGHPSRRAWLSVVVRDEADRVVFASGLTDPQGRLTDAAGAPLAIERAGGPMPRHRDRVQRSEDVPVYQATMQGGDGEPTHLLLRATGWWSDNRLLPEGYRPDHPDASRTAPVGVEGDRDFRAGEDGVHYDLPLPGTGPLTVEVSLCYQSVGARWVAELFEWDTPQVAAFRALWTGGAPGPQTLASIRQVIAPR